MKRATKPAPKRMTFEKALAALRKGATTVRRIAWHPQSKVVRVGDDLFVLNKPIFGAAPKKWEPYPQDFLATDWVVVE